MMASRVLFVAVLAAGSLAGIGCGSGGNGAVVMVIDEGIDLSAGDLQGKVAATYTETCVDDSRAAAPMRGAGRRRRSLVRHAQADVPRGAVAA